MRIIHSGGFPMDERRQTRAVIYNNIVVAFKVLLEIMESQAIAFENESSKVRVPLFGGGACRLLGIAIEGVALENRS
jgi:hypothetical protein